MTPLPFIPPREAVEYMVPSPARVRRAFGFPVLILTGGVYAAETVHNLNQAGLRERIAEHQASAIYTPVSRRAIEDAGLRLDQRLVAVSTIHVVALRVRLAERIEHLEVLPRWCHPVQGPRGQRAGRQRGSWPHCTAIKQSVPRLQQRGCVAFAGCELMQNPKVVAPAIHYPRDGTTMRDATSVLPAKPGGAVKITIVADDHGAQRIGSVIVVPVRIQRAERMQHGELTGGGDFEDRAGAVLAPERRHAIDVIIGTARQCNTRIGSVLVVSVRIQCAERMQHCIPMRLQVELVDDALPLIPPS